MQPLNAWGIIDLTNQNSKNPPFSTVFGFSKIFGKSAYTEGFSRFWLVKSIIPEFYNERNKIERAFGRIKDWRRVATRY